MLNQACFQVWVHRTFPRLMVAEARSAETSYRTLRTVAVRMWVENTNEMRQNDGCANSAGAQRLPS